jgi:hypothetical protein
MWRLPGGLPQPGRRTLAQPRRNAALPILPSCRYRHFASNTVDLLWRSLEESWHHVGVQCSQHYPCHVFVLGFSGSEAVPAKASTHSRYSSEMMVPPPVSSNMRIIQQNCSPSFLPLLVVIDLDISRLCTPASRTTCSPYCYSSLLSEFSLLGAATTLKLRGPLDTIAEVPSSI